MAWFNSFGDTKRVSKAWASRLITRRMTLFNLVAPYKLLNEIHIV